MDNNIDEKNRLKDDGKLINLNSPFGFGLEKVAKMKKTLGNIKALAVFSVFFNDWLTLKEASFIYNPNHPKDAPNNKTTRYYYLKFLEYGWLDQKEVIQNSPRKTAKGKNSIYPAKVKKYRANFEAFFFMYPDFYRLEPILTKESMREKIILEHKKSGAYPYGIFEIMRMKAFSLVKFPKLKWEDVTNIF